MYFLNVTQHFKVEASCSSSSSTAEINRVKVALAPPTVQDRVMCLFFHARVNKGDVLLSAGQMCSSAASLGLKIYIYIYISKV